MTKLAQNCIATNCTEFIGKDEWPPNSTDVNPLDYHVSGVMLEHYKIFQVFNPSQRTLMDWRKSCSWYKSSCRRIQSTRPYWPSQNTWNMRWIFRTCFEKNCLTSQVTVHFFSVILKYGIKEAVKAVVLEAVKVSRWNFKGLFKTHSVISRETLLKISTGCREMHFVQWDIFEPPRGGSTLGRGQIHVLSPPPRFKS